MRSARCARASGFGAPGRHRGGRLLRRAARLRADARARRVPLPRIESRARRDVAFVGGPDLGVFAAALALENFSEGFAGTALIAWMSSLTTFGYAATQYALLSSFYAILGKILKGLSGVAVETLDRTFDSADRLRRVLRDHGVDRRAFRAGRDLGRARSRDPRAR